MAVARKIEVTIESPTAVSPSKYIPDPTRYQNVVDFILSNTNSAAVAYEDNHGTVNQWGAGCHGGLFNDFDRKVNYKYLASVCSYGKKTYVNTHTTPETAKIIVDSIQEYLEFIFSNESPWKNVHRGTAEIIRDKDGLIRGFILGREHFQTPEYSGIFNLLLAARLCRYNNWLFQNYHALRQIDLGILESFILGYYLQPTVGEAFTRSGRTWDGANTCFSEVRYDYTYGKGFYTLGGNTLPVDKRVPSGLIDLKAIKAGDYKFRNVPDQNHISSQGWQSPCDSMTKALSMRLLNPEFVQKTAFSSVAVIPAETVKEIAKSLFD